MPEKRGRRRRGRERGPRESAPVATADATPASSPGPAPALAVPSNTARATGFAIAVVTMFLAVLTIGDALSGDRDTIDAIMRGVVGVFLVLLAIVVGALSLFPAQVRKIVRGV